MANSDLKIFAEENLLYMSFYTFEENEDLHIDLKTKKKTLEDLN